jgi:hypothetical protein
MNTKMVYCVYCTKPIAEIQESALKYFGYAVCRECSDKR